MHIIAHSLGAHLAGYAGEKLRYLGRITGSVVVGVVCLFCFRCGAFIDIIHPLP